MDTKPDKSAQKASKGGPGAPLSIWRQSGINIVMLRNDLTEISQHKVMNLFNFHQFYTIIVI